MSGYFKALTQLRHDSILTLLTFLLLFLIDKTRVSFFIKLLNTQFFMNRLFNVVAHYCIKIFYATLIKY